MRIALIFIISTLTLSANGQVDSIKPIIGHEAGVTIISRYDFAYNAAIDTIPFVEYVKPENIGLQPAFYINGIFSNSIIAVDPMQIDSIHIEKTGVDIGNKRYDGQIFIKMKNEYTPKIISLTNLAMKYTNLKDGFTIFMIDNEIIKEDYDQCFVDEKYILKIVVDTIEMGKGKANVNVVRLLTRSKENIEKSKEVKIRGINQMTLN